MQYCSRSEQNGRICISTNEKLQSGDLFCKSCKMVKGGDSGYCVDCFEDDEARADYALLHRSTGQRRRVAIVSSCFVDGIVGCRDAQIDLSCLLKTILFLKTISVGV